MVFHHPWKNASEKDRAQRKLLLILLLNTIVFATVYFTVAQYFSYIPIVYLALAGAVTLGYLLYNRGFSRRNVTPEQLPDTMTSEEKTAWIEDGTRRLRRSRWVLTILLPLLLTFLMDLVYLFVYPSIEKLFK